MKFGSVLKELTEESEEATEIYAKYKHLKKFIKQLGEEGSGEGDEGRDTEKESAFLAAIESDVHDFNEDFMEKEENFVIEAKRVKDSFQAMVASPSTPDQRAKALTDVVNLHGAMVMQLHWSMVQWTFLSKILKKHDKRTGILLRQPLLARLANEPFFSSRILERLIKELEDLYLSQGGGMGVSGTTSAGGASPQKSVGSGPVDVRPLLGTRAAEVQVALNTWREVAGNASTPSTLAPIAGPLPSSLPAASENPSRASSTPPPPQPHSSHS